MARKIYIDGDGSPVKEDVFEISSAYGIDVVLVTSLDHYSSKEVPENVKLVYVDAGRDAADFKIVQLIQKNDILITQDYGLASLVLGKGALPLHQLGFIYTSGNIDSLLQSRFLHQLDRKNGNRTRGPKPFTKENHDVFQQKLIDIIQSNYSGGR
ncbi:MAG: YaiI/YqxD family protein [Streptococcaceae bacterium]|jgi:uncharacterized protein YaiI (UPF0178 family)|nr:YaiI/YqxD family protein [Streptococcaceae bacterium]